MIIIFVSGFKFLGKDTFSNFVKEYLDKAGQKNKIVHLADKLKNSCSEHFKLSNKYMFDPDLKEIKFPRPMTMTRNIAEAILDDFQEGSGKEFAEKHIGKKFSNPREIMQYVGTEVLRDLDEMTHCKHLEKDHLIDEETVYIVADHRFKNESEYFKKNYTTETYFITRKEMIPDKEGDLHISERSMFEIMNTSCRVANDKSMEDLREEARDIARCYVAYKRNA